MSGLTNEAKKYVESYEQLPALHEKDPNEVREILASAPAFTDTLPSIRQTIDDTIAVSQGEIPIRIYTPKGSGPFPIMLYYHGGGWVTGSIDAVDPTCHLLCAKTKHIVISVGYRLAPEHKFPIPVQDAYAALLWAYDHAKSLNGDQDFINVCGDSAGGTLAAVTAINAKENNGPNIHAQILIYPVTDLSFESDSYEIFKEGYGLTKDLMIWLKKHYLSLKIDETNPLASPLHADNLTDLPAALVFTAEFDVLHDEGIAYANRLKQAGVPVQQITKFGLVHAFFTEPTIFLNDIEQTMKEINHFLDTLANKA